MRLAKRVAIVFMALLIGLLCGCSGSPNFSLIYYDMIQLDGVNYSRLEPFGEAQPPNQVGELVQIYLVGYNGKVDYKKTYEARTYANDPECLFLFFDGVDWVKEGHFDEWTAPHIP